MNKLKEKHNEAIERAVFLKGQTASERCAEVTKEVSIKFAEWIKENAYHHEGNWYLHKAMSGEIYTTSELFIIFLEKYDYDNRK